MENKYPDIIAKANDWYNKLPLVVRNQTFNSKDAYINADTTERDSMFEFMEWASLQDYVYDKSTKVWYDTYEKDEVFFTTQQLHQLWQTMK